MNLQEEKHYIYSLMKDVTEERRQLTEVFYSLKKQLDRLNELELTGLEDLKLTGYADLFNQRQLNLSMKNIQRETAHLREEKKTPNTSNTFEPPVGQTVIDDFIDESKPLDTPTATVKPKINKEKDSIIPKEVIARAKEKESKNKNKLISLDKMMGLIATTLKESFTPMELKDIHAEVQRKAGHDIKLNNFRNNILPRALQKNKNIERASRGFYQYRVK